MSIDYNEYLTVHDKIKILDKRMKELASEAYKLEINHNIYKAVGDNISAETCTKSLEVLKVAIVMHRAELNHLPVAEYREKIKESNSESDEDKSDLVI